MPKCYPVEQTIGSGQSLRLAEEVIIYIHGSDAVGALRKACEPAGHRTRATADFDNVLAWLNIRRLDH